MGSNKYAPALIRSDGASSDLGFSTKSIILPSFFTFATPNSDTFSTGHNDIVEIAFFFSWNLIISDRSREDIISLFKTRKCPVICFSANLTAPPVPKGFGSLFTMISIS